MISHIILKSQCGQTFLGKSQTAFEFFHHLIRTDDQVAFRNGELADTCQAVHFPGILISEQCRGFAVAKRQVAVGALSGFIYIILEGAGHGTQSKHFFVRLLISQNKHAVLVVVPVTGYLV